MNPSPQPSPPAGERVLGSTIFRKFHYLFFGRRRPFKLTRGGWIFILYTIGVGAGAINTGNNLLYLLFGVFLGLILASGVLSDLTLWGLSANLHFPKTGRAGQPLIVPADVHNSKRWISSLSVRMEVEAQLGAEAVLLEAFLPSVEKGQSSSTLLAFVPGRRGWLEWTGLKFSTRFPFGLLTKTWVRELPRFQSRFDPESGLIIRPALLPVETEAILSLMDKQSRDEATHQKGDGPNLYGLRAYQPADHPRRIHWRASAKRPSGWLVREMEKEQDQQIFLEWPTTFPSNLEKNTFERFVSFSATIAEDLSQKKLIPHVMVEKDGQIYLASGDLLDGFLALVGPDDPFQSDGSSFLSLWRQETISQPLITIPLWEAFTKNELGQAGNHGRT